MQFYSGYYHAMDREYDPVAKPKKDPMPGIREIGTSTAMKQPGSQTLRARISHGGSRIELAFMGFGKGSEQGPTPGSYGRRDREEMRAMAKVNEVETSTHASVNIGFPGMNLAGSTREGFDDSIREQAVNEVKRAIDFAADATTGGPVVVHTGEWNRPLVEKYPEFKAYPEEKEKAVVSLVDKQTGALINLRKDQRVFDPVVKTWKTDPRTGEKVPEEYEYEKDGTVKIKEKTYDQIVKEERERAPLTKKTDEQLFVKHFFATQRESAEAQAYRWVTHTETYKKTLDKVKSAKDYYTELVRITPPEERWKLRRQVERELPFTIPEYAEPLEYLERQEKEINREILWMEEASRSSSRQVAEIDKKIRDSVPVEEYGIKKTADSVAKLGITAMQESQAKAKDLTRPLYVAPENVFPETYGSHPDELRKIIVESRKAMSEKLVKQGYNASTSDELARKHIKATFDIGHVGIWKKHFQPLKGESPKQTDKRFYKWVISEAKKLAKEGILGHIHLADNFGFHDEHLAVGQGELPIKEFVESMKEAGLTSFIVEPGTFNFETIMPDTWRELGAPIYSGAVGSWSELHHSYFGRTQPPYFIFGEYSPSHDFRGAPFYTGVPLE